MLKLPRMVKLLMKKIISYFPLLYFLVFISVFFRKSLVYGLVPTPFDLLVTWFYPYNLGGWFSPGWLTEVKGGWFASDAIRQMYPWRELSVSLLKEGIMPLWNPYNFSGTPLLANIQSSIFYPATLIFYLLGNFNQAWTIYIASSVVFAALFMYLFLLSLKLSRLSALFGAVAFAASGYMIVWLEWGVMGQEFALIPLSLFALNRWFESGKKSFFFLLILSLTLTILAGYPQGAAYNLLIFIFWFLFLIISGKKDRLQKIKSVLVAGAIAVGLSAVQWLPTAELYIHSAMKGEVSQSLSKNSALPFFRLVSVLAPDYFGNSSSGDYWANTFSAVDYMGADLYVGSVTFLFALFAVLNRKKIKGIGAFLGLIGLGLAIGMKSPLSVFISMLNIPVISTGSAASAMQIVIFSLCCLASIGFDAFHSENKRPTITKSVLLITACYLLLTVFSLAFDGEKTGIALRSLVVPGLAFLIASFLVLQKFKKLSKNFLGFSLILIISLELLLHADKLLPFASPGFAFPRHPLVEELKTVAGVNRIDGFWENEISSNFQTALRLYSPEGYDPLYIRRYGELLAFSQAGNLPPVISRADADIGKNDDTYRNRIIDLSSVKYITAQVTNPEVVWEEEPLKYDPGRFRLVWQKDKFKIYQNLKAVPRASLFTSWRIIEGKESLITALYSPDFDPLKEIILENDPGIQKSPASQNRAEISNYQPNRVEIITAASTDSILLLTDSYYPGWRVTIDSQPSEVLRANYAFRAVAVPAGNHRLEFIYRPLSFSLGLTVTLTSFITLLLLAGLDWHKTRKYPRKMISSR